MIIENTRTRGQQGAIVEGEFLLTANDFARIAGMLHGDAGIALSPSKATLLYSRLAKRLRALGLTDFSQYCDLLNDPAQLAERRMMLAALTTNVTRFFREPHHFEHLRQHRAAAAARRRAEGRAPGAASGLRHAPAGRSRTRSR